MFNVTRRVSFSVVIALLLGWGAMSFMIFQSAEYSIASERNNGYFGAPLKGVKMLFQVDKKVYRGGEPVLISLRNDSRKPIYLSTSALGCGQTWWALQQLGTDETDWRTVTRSKDSCTGITAGLEDFAKGTLKTDVWNGLIQTNAIGEVYLPAETGIYRFLVPYLVGPAAEEDWGNAQALLSSSSFTIQ